MGLLNFFFFTLRCIFFTALVSYGVIVLPDHYFGDTKFNPNQEVELKNVIPSNVQVVDIPLDKIEKINYEGKIIKPEAIKFHNNFLYATLENGQIIKVDEKSKKVTVIARANEKDSKICDNTKIVKENCGRFLDIDIIGNKLYATESFKGFIEYDLIKNTKLMFNIKDTFEEFKNKNLLFNSIRQDPVDSNLVYISISSTKYSYDKAFVSIIENENSGYLIAFNKTSKTTTILAKDLYFANGIEILNDKKSLILNELKKAHIIKFDLTEIKEFIKKPNENLVKYKVVANNLLGTPDNITKNNNNILVAFFVYFPKNFYYTNLMQNKNLSKLAFRLSYLGSQFLNYIDKFYKCSCLDELKLKLERGLFFNSVLEKESAIGVFDSNQKLFKLIQLPLGSVTHAIYDSNTKYLYFGSVVHEFIGKFKIDL